MKLYFDMLENYIKSCDLHYDSIKDLTIDLAYSGGYHRDIYKFECGTYRERTMYTGKFNSDLSAMWLCFYKKLFISKLNRYPELQEYHVFIINKTFYMVMGCLNIDKLVCDDIVNKYVNMTLNSRIKDALEGIRKDVEEDAFYNNIIFNNRMFSLDYLIMQKGDYWCNEIEEIDYLELELRKKLENNSLGNRLLDYLLFSNEKVDLKNIDRYMELDKSECTEENKVVIADAFNIIKHALVVYNGKIKKFFRKIDPSNIHYSFEH